MSAFKQLKDVSNNFEQQLKSLSTQLIAAKIGETFEDNLSQRLQDLTFFTSKLRLLKAKPISALPQITEEPKSEDTIDEYGELAQWKVLEQFIVKSLTQAHAVKALITASDTDLDPEMLERKEKIILSLKEFRNKETQLRYLQMLEAEKEAELADLRKQWDRELTELRELKEDGNQLEECDVSDPLYKKLRNVVDKLELMRWLVGKLVTSRGGCDWLASPSHTAHLLALARTHHTVQSFLHE